MQETMKTSHLPDLSEHFITSVLDALQFALQEVHKTSLPECAQVTCAVILQTSTQDTCSVLTSLA